MEFNRRIDTNRRVTPPLSSSPEHQVLESYHQKTSLKQPANIVPVQPRFENVSLDNTKHVTFGNKTFYNGPVTINQFQVSSQINKADSCKNVNNKANNGSNIHQSGTQVYTKKSFAVGDYNVRKIVLAILIVLILVIILTVLIIIGVSFIPESIPISSQPDSSGEYVNYTSEEEGEKNLTANHPRIITRQEWFAQPPRQPLVDLRIPIENIIISHTASSNCFDKKTCIYRIQNMQKYHVESRGFDDIGVNFLIGGDGLVYEGRGWEKRGVHTAKYNNKSICIAFIGKFTEVEPKPKQISAAKLLLVDGLNRKMLTPNYCLFAQMQLSSTESPGLAFYQTIRKWSHWCDVYT